MRLPWQGNGCIPSLGQFDKCGVIWRGGFRNPPLQDRLCSKCEICPRGTSLFAQPGEIVYTSRGDSRQFKGKPPMRQALQG